MASLNRVQLIGNLGQDPEIRYTQSQTAVCTLSLATTEYRNNAETGEKEANTTWHRVVVWGKTAENCGKYLSKGRQAYVEGRLQTRQWEDQNGQKRYTTEVVAQNVLFLGGQGQSTGAMRGNAPSAGGQQQMGGGQQQQQGGGQSMGGSQDFGSGGMDPSLEDIPF